MELFSFVILLSGILFVMRTMDVFRKRGLIHELVVTKTGTTTIIAMSFALFLTIKHLWPQVFLVTLLAALPFTLFLLIEYRRTQNFRSRIPIFLDRWILNLRIGNSMIAARDKALRSEAIEFQALLRPIFETRGGERSGHLILTPNMRKELEEISLVTHFGLERLINLREIVRRSSDFRRKSGQAARQTQIQSLVMVVLVFALSMFTIQRYGFAESGDFVIGALILTSLGVLLMVKIGKKSRWKL